MDKFYVSLSVCRHLRKKERLDAFLACCFPQFSRVQLQDWIKQGKIKINKEEVKQSFNLQGGEEIIIKGDLPAVLFDKPQPMELDIAYEDSDLLIINKPAGLVVHPGAGNPDHTLLNALLAYRAEQEELPRAGLVHRLDKGTSGLIIAAKNPPGFNYLQKIIKQRRIKRNYIALVEGVPVSGGTINLPLGRDPHNRIRMKAVEVLDAVVNNGKIKAPSRLRHAVTNFRVVERFAAHTLLKVSLETGRTHQIRAHLNSLGYPLVGDSLYGWQKKLPPDCGEDLAIRLRGLSMPVLHSFSLEFAMKNGRNLREISVEAPLPAEFFSLLGLLRQANSDWNR